MAMFINTDFSQKFLANVYRITPLKPSGRIGVFFIVKQDNFRNTKHLSKYILKQLICFLLWNRFLIEENIYLNNEYELANGHL